MDFVIETYWNVESTYLTLNFIAAFMGGSGWLGLLKFVFLCALMTAMLKFAYDRDIGDLLKWFAQAYLLVVVFMAPVSSVAVVDKLNQEPPKVVGNVPWLIAGTSWAINTVTGWLAVEYEKLANVPGSLRLTSTGDMGFGQALIRNTNQITITNPYLRADLMQYIKECALYDMQDGVLSVDDLMNKTNSWSLMFSKTNPARFVTLGTVKGDPKTYSCVDAASILDTNVTSGVEAAMRYYGKNAFNNFNPNVAYNMYVGALGQSYSWILGANQNASDAVKQAMFNNIMRSANSELPALINDPTRIQEIIASGGAAMAAEQSKGSANVVSKLAFEAIPTIRNWLESVLYSLFPICVLWLVIARPNNTLNILSAYLSSFIGLGLIPVFYTSLNHLSMVYLKKQAEAMELAQGVPFSKLSVLDSTVIDEQAMLGFFVLIILLLAAWAARAFNGGILSVAPRLLSSMTSAGSSVGGSLAMGNTSLGETALDTKTVNNTSMNKYDGNLSMSRGLSTYTNESGTSHTITPNGLMNTQKLEDVVPHSLHTGQSINRSNEQRYSQSTDSSFTRSTDQNVVSGSTTSDSFSRTQNYGTEQTTGVSNSVNRGTNVSNQYDSGINENNTNSTGHTLEDGRTVYTALSTGISGHGGIGAAGGVGGDNGQRVAGSPTNPGQTMPTGNNANASNGASGGTGGKGGKGGKAGFNVGADVNAQGQMGVNYNANQSDSKSSTNAVDQYRSISRGIGTHAGTDYSRTDTGSVNSSTGHGFETSASRFTNTSHTDGQNASISDRNGYDQSTAYSSSHQLEQGYNLAASPEFKRDVAKHFEMDQLQFSNLPADEQIRLMKQYRDEEVNAIQTTPSSYENGQPIAFNLPKDFNLNQSKVGSTKEIDSDFQKNANRIGTNIERVNADTKAPESLSRTSSTLEDVNGEMNRLNSSKAEETREASNKKAELKDRVDARAREDVKDAAYNLASSLSPKQIWKDTKAAWNDVTGNSDKNSDNSTQINNNGASIGQWSKKDVDPK
ncbi:conjugal transfer protein TraG N-terminal domain-containing protein [Acinetobacter nosocomialis]|uniref:conjugal transfer protein TraG N-terminal domain-containing protein n=1 Tax=Acinetobacter nosocomialis TaxID=106654 RepID=UPI0029DA582B|nr:conjugal transfer protein TraG N-terminal domain-containing protein [Acinetobacter nosocomialis]MDX7882097.1 conjugal transfer protein TraG N-terminal domain-containing protein [Acinetobacter nosocomialis]